MAETTIARLIAEFQEAKAKWGSGPTSVSDYYGKQREVIVAMTASGHRTVQYQGDYWSIADSDTLIRVPFHVANSLLGAPWADAVAVDVSWVKSPKTETKQRDYGIHESRGDLATHHGGDNAVFYAKRNACIRAGKRAKVVVEAKGDIVVGPDSFVSVGEDSIVSAGEDSIVVYRYPDKDPRSDVMWHAAAYVRGGDGEDGLATLKPNTPFLCKDGRFLQ